MFGWPAVAQQPGDGDLEDGRVGAERAVGQPLGVLVPDDAPAWVTVEEPLSGVVGVGVGEAVGVPLVGDLLPVIEVEGNLDEGGVGDVEFLVDLANRLCVLRRRAESPDGGQRIVVQGT